MGRGASCDMTGGEQVREEYQKILVVRAQLVEEDDMSNTLVCQSHLVRAKGIKGCRSCAVILITLQDIFQKFNNLCVFLGRTRLLETENYKFSEV